MDEKQVFDGKKEEEQEIKNRRGMGIPINMLLQQQ
jgi:hypothetical protein